MNRVILLGVNSQFKVTGVQDPVSLDYIDDATVTVTLLRNNGDEVVGETWPKAMVFVPNSNGEYACALSNSLVANDGEVGAAVVSITHALLTTQLSLEVVYQTYDQSQLEWTSRTDLELMFGRENVRVWADMENSEDPESDIARKIQWAIREATADAQSRLAGGPVIPERLTDVRGPLRVAVTRLAGILLYECRGLVDTSSEDGVHRLKRHEKLADEFFWRVNAGQITLADHVRTHPAVFRDDSVETTGTVIQNFDYLR